MRGGGSRTDLACFDAEEIAVAIAQCGLPVFTGIGHEIDHSIADEVAYASYKTPTACASAICELVNEYVEETEDVWASIAGIAQQQLALAESRLNERGNAIRTKAITAVERAHTHVALGASRLATRPISLLATHESQVNYLAERVRLLDPVNTMARGWSITRTATGVTLRKAGDAISGDDIVTTFSDGTVVSTVK
jgi:exodeoxyribonuclease VII large subunit